MLNRPELCDGLEQGGETCFDLGADAGSLGCDAWCQRTFDSCFSERWSGRDPGTTESLSEVWGSADDDIFVVGANSTILHYDGNGWSPMALGTSVNLFGVWGSSATEVFAVGFDGKILRLTANLPTPDGGSCARPVRIYCESTLHGSNVGQTSAFDSYAACGGASPDTGAEVYYRLHNPVDGLITVQLTPHEANLDLIVVGANAGGGCDPTGQCLAASQQSGTATEIVTFPSTAGETNYLIVDGYDFAQSGYTIEVSCTKQ